MPWITSPACTRFSKWCGMSPNTSCSMYWAYVGVISRCLVSNEDVPLCVRDHAWRYYWNMQTEHCSKNRCPPRKVSEWRWWIWGEEGIDMLSIWCKVYTSRSISTERRDSLIVPIDKEEWNIQDCGDCRGIKLIYLEDSGKGYWETV